MKYDLQQLSSLISNLELDIEKVTESERRLKDFFNFNSSSDYYIEHIDVLNSLLNCCTQLTEEDLKINKNFSVVYELLRNDLYKYKSKEIKKKNIHFDQIDQLEFFNFLNKLYNDPDFIERNSRKNNELLIQVKEIHNKLESILRYQIEKYFENTKLDNKRIKDFNFQSKQELYDEAYNRLMQLDLSSCLKNIYYKDAIFTIKDDLKFLYVYMHTEYAQKQSSIFKKYLKKYLKLDLDLQKDKDLLVNLGLIFGASSVASVFPTVASNPVDLSEFLKMYGISFISAFAPTSVVLMSSDARSRKIEEKQQKQDALHEKNVIKQKYEQLENELFYNAALEINYSIEEDKEDIEENKKKETQLEDEAFYNASIVMRYNNNVVEQLKSVIRKINNNTIDEQQLDELLEDGKPIQKAFKQLEQQLIQLQKQKQSEIETNAQLTTPYVLSQELKQIYGEFKQHFKTFSQEDLNKLLQLVATSPEKVEQIKEFIKTSLLFNKDLSTIKTFEELMQRVLEHSEQKQNKTQNYLQKMLEEAENVILPQIQRQYSR